MTEKKTVGRNVAIALGIICMFLTVGLIVLVADYALVISEKDNTLSLQNSLQAQNKQVQSWLFGNQTYLGDQLWAARVREGAEIAGRDSLIADLNHTILSLNSEISDLARAFLNVSVYSATVGELSLDPAIWVNKTIFVEGNLTFLSLSFEAFADGYKWNYQLTSNGNHFLLLWEPDWLGSPSYDGSNAIIIGVVRQTTIYVSPSYVTAYYIEAEKIVPL